MSKGNYLHLLRVNFFLQLLSLSIVVLSGNNFFFFFVVSVISLLIWLFLKYCNLLHHNFNIAVLSKTFIIFVCKMIAKFKRTELTFNLFIFMILLSFVIFIVDRANVRFISLSLHCLDSDWEEGGSYNF